MTDEIPEYQFNHTMPLDNELTQVLELAGRLKLNESHRIKLQNAFNSFKDSDDLRQMLSWSVQKKHAAAIEAACRKLLGLFVDLRTHFTTDRSHDQQLSGFESSLMQHAGIKEPIELLDHLSSLQRECSSIRDEESPDNHRPADIYADGLLRELAEVFSAAGGGSTRISRKGRDKGPFMDFAWAAIKLAHGEDRFTSKKAMASRWERHLSAMSAKDRENIEGSADGV